MTRVKIFIVGIIGLLICCKSIDNKKESNLKRLIDKQEFNEVIYEIELDNQDNKEDTLSIEKLKFDENGNVLYRELRMNFVEYESITKSYFTSNKELFYEERTEIPVEIHSIYTTKLNDKDQVEEAMMISNILESNKLDTSMMEFQRKYSEDGKLEELTVIGNIEEEKAVNKIYFNRFEKPVLEYYTLGRDTLNKHKYYYQSDEILTKIEIERFGNETIRTIKNFNEKGSYREINMNTNQERLVLVKVEKI